MFDPRISELLLSEEAVIAQEDAEESSSLITLPVPARWIARVERLDRWERQALILLTAPDWYGQPSPFSSWGTPLAPAIERLQEQGLALWTARGATVSTLGETLVAVLLLGQVYPCLTGNGFGHVWEPTMVVGWMRCPACEAVRVCRACFLAAYPGMPCPRQPMPVACSQHASSGKAW